MPHFIDLFQEVLRKKKNHMREMINRDLTSSLQNRFKELFHHHWHPLPKTQSPDAHIFAVDGSGGLRQYSTGALLYVARAFGISNHGKTFRVLDADIFLARGGEEEIRKYLTLKVEYMELLAAIQSLKLTESPSYILIDGSLYGRAMHLVKEAAAEGDRDFPLHYMETYCNLIEECRQKGVIPIGISKDSRAEFFRNKILDWICIEKLEHLKGIIEPEDLRALRYCLKNLDEKPHHALARFSRLKEKYGEVLDCFEDLLDEYRRGMSDFQVIKNHAQTPGYTTPIELGPARPNAIRRFRAMRDNPERYLRLRFRNTLADMREQENDLLKYGVTVLKQVVNFPTVVSFHLLMDTRDTPIRVDIPSWVIGLNHHMGEFEGSQFLEEKVDAVTTIIEVLKRGYAGLRNYNVWLSAADERVRLKRRDIDEIYEPLLSRELGLTLIHSRRYRRVKYP